MMDAFTSHTGVVLPLDRANIDTDALLPKQYLKAICKFGYGDWLFDELRYLDSGDVETATASRRIDPDFILNQDAYIDSSIVLAREDSASYFLKLLSYLVGPHDEISLDNFPASDTGNRDWRFDDRHECWCNRRQPRAH
jgi:hypothetical protein